MKAVYYDDFGDANVLNVGDRPIPEPGPGEVLLQVGAASVNPIDRRLRAGELQHFFERAWPITPGWDVSGKIVKLGPDVEGWKEGDEVMGLAFNWKLGAGTYAEYAPISVDSMTAKPKAFSHVEAACIPLVNLTAWQTLVEYGELKAGQKVFVQAGAGGLGAASIQIAKHFGAHVYTTCRAENEAYVKGFGADVVIDYTKVNYYDALKEMEPDGVDIVLELLLRDDITKNAIHLAKQNGVVVYLNNEPPDMPEVAAKNIKTQFFHHRADGAMLKTIVELYENGTLKLPEIKVMSLDDAVEAHKLSEAGRTRGKVALKIADI